MERRYFKRAAYLLALKARMGCSITGARYKAPGLLNEINVHQPDIIFVSKRNRILTDAGADGAPDFIVEILSPKTAYLDKKSKKRVFGRSGGEGAWIIDPDTKSIHVYYLQQDGEDPVATYHFHFTPFPGPQIQGRQNLPAVAGLKR